jgi:hypothetical protein
MRFKQRKGSYHLCRVGLMCERFLKCSWIGDILSPVNLYKKKLLIAYKNTNSLIMVRELWARLGTTLFIYIVLVF